MKKTNVILTSYPLAGWTPTRIKLGTWTDEQKEQFLATVKKHTPWGYIDHCVFSVHFDNSVIHSRSFDTPRTFTPHVAKNKPNELIIEVIPDMEYTECWPICPATCPMCIQDGQCTSLFIRKFVGEVLFPKKYAKQR